MQEQYLYNETHRETIQRKSHERYLRRRHTPEYKLTKTICDNRYRARLVNCKINDFTAKQAKLLLAKATHCPICGERFLKNDRKALDHIVPLSKDGNNTLLNIWVTHLGCNLKKSNRHYANYGDGQLLLIPKFQESPFKKPEPIILTEKKCLHCGIIKPVGMFGENKTARDGHFGVCKRCAKIYRQKYGKERREKRRRYFAEYPEEHLWEIEKQHPKQRQWQQERIEKDPDYYKKLYYQNREYNLAYAKKYYEEHREYFLEHGRKYYYENRIHCNRVSREWAAKHEERVRENGKRWRAEHPDYMKNYYWANKRVPARI